MLFNSIEFLIFFLPIVFLVYFFSLKLKNKDLTISLLIIFSLIFYSFWNFSLTYVIIISIFVNIIILLIYIKFKYKLLIILGIIFNIAYLAYFKYTNYLFQTLFELSFLNQKMDYSLALPLAISFFSFQQISFLIDFKSSNTSKLSINRYILHVIFFPQLIAGPIVKLNELYSSLDKLFINNKEKIYENIFIGIFLISIGLFKKVIIAEYFEEITFNFVASQPSNVSFLEVILFAFLYSFEIYFDFSAYCDMAIGSARLFNINLPLNFNSPYKSKNFIDFWQRWHITLSRFINDYIFKKLFKIFYKIGNIFFSIAFPVLISFLISGIWHGAGHNFILWGILHGFFVLLSHMNKRLKIFDIKSNFVKIFITFFLVSLLWIPFRVSDIGYILTLYTGLFNFNLNGLFLNNFNIYINNFFYGNIFFLLGSLIIIFGIPNIYQFIDRLKTNQKSFFLYNKYLISIFIIILFFISIINLEQLNEFIYFQF